MIYAVNCKRMALHTMSSAWGGVEYLGYHPYLDSLLFAILLEFTVTF